MADVLALYAAPSNPHRPTVTCDETSPQRIADMRAPLSTRPGQPRREAYESRRHGTRNLCRSSEPQAGWRHLEVTAQRTMHDVAHQMRGLVEHRDPDADVMRVVLDHLTTHRPAARYEPFAPAEARRILKTLAFH
jgi:DDE superfamily endonuclease